MISRLVDSTALLLQLVTGKKRKEVIKTFGLQSNVVINGLVYLGMQGLLEKQVKTWCAWPMARALGEELPPRKLEIDYRYLLGNKVRRFLISRIPAGRKGKPIRMKALKIAESCLKLKDCMVEVPSNFVEDSFQDYRTTLTAKPLDDRKVKERWGEEREREEWEDNVEEGDCELKKQLQERIAEMRFDRLHENIILSLRKTVDEVFKPVHPSCYDDDEVIPSMGSSFHGNRTAGGQWGRLQEIENEVPDPFLTLDLIHMTESHTSCGRRVIEIYGKVCEFKGSFLLDHREELANDSELGQLEAMGRWEIKSPVPIKARIVPILESCKVRWVSIGEAQPYYRAKAWNRLVYRQMPKHPAFELTGRPLIVDDVEGKLGGFKYLLSGDYKGATDTLDPWWSNLTLELITQRLYARADHQNSMGDWHTRMLGLQGMLTGHDMVYQPPPIEVDGVKVKQEPITFSQKTGQLMGSFLSFPILCVLNAAVNRCFLEPSLESPIAELPLLVNGDDVMMAKDDPFLGWKAHIGLVGLRPSLGKNYVHTHVCCLNSQFYTREDIDSPFTRIHPYRLNLAYGVGVHDKERSLFGARSWRGDDCRSRGTLGAKARLLVKHHDEEEVNLLLTKFIDENLEILKATRRSWWVPEELGGLGLPLTPETVKKVTPVARSIATYLMNLVSPEDVKLYAPRVTSQSASAVRVWMRACDKLHSANPGVEYRWLDEDDPLDEEVSPPISLRSFTGLSVVSELQSPHDRYEKVMRLALSAVRDPKVDTDTRKLTPCSDEALLRFAEKPRKAGWVKKRCLCTVCRYDENSFNCPETVSYRAQGNGMFSRVATAPEQVSYDDFMRWMDGDVCVCEGTYMETL